MVVGFGGSIGVGKTTNSHLLSRILKENGYDSEVFSFADPLRSFCSELLGKDFLALSKDREQKDVAKECYSVFSDTGKWLSPRDVLKAVGSSIRASFSDDIFCTLMTKRIEDSSCDFIFVDDVRWPVEAGLFLDDSLSRDRFLVSLFRDGVENSWDYNFGTCDYEIVTLPEADINSEAYRDFLISSFSGYLGVRGLI